MSEIVVEDLSPNNTLATVCAGCGRLDDFRIVSPYRFNVKYDDKYFPCKSLLECHYCKIIFAHPLPSNEILTEYYSNVYRAKGRPHFCEVPPTVSSRHLAYLSYITSFIDLKKIINIYEVGAGWGEIGFLLKQLYPEISLYTSEPDLHVQQNLIKSGYTIIDEKSEALMTYDFIISTHSMEHFNNCDNFFETLPSLRCGGYLFIEVPNCPIDIGWLDRPYDSPHLLFFNQIALKNIFLQANFTNIAMSVAGHSLNTDFEFCRLWKSRFENWTPDKARFDPLVIFNAKSIIKRIVPKKVWSMLRQTLVGDAKQSIEDTASDFNNSSEQGWLLRGIFIKESK
jgi:hypothetical protein